jgi:hypothetical protein
MSPAEKSGVAEPPSTCIVSSRKGDHAEGSGSLFQDARRRE